MAKIIEKKAVKVNKMSRNENDKAALMGNEENCCE